MQNTALFDLDCPVILLDGAGNLVGPSTSNVQRYNFLDLLRCPRPSDYFNNVSYVHTCCLYVINEATILDELLRMTATIYSPKDALPQAGPKSPFKYFLDGLAVLRVFGLPLKADSKDGTAVRDSKRFLKCIVFTYALAGTLQIGKNNAKVLNIIGNIYIHILLQSKRAWSTPR